MMRNLFADRFKLVAHIEERDREGFALVLARSDGKLGPQLKKSAVDCAGADGPRCGGRMGIGRIENNGSPIDGLARSFSGFAGGPVTNRTGLEGFYDLTLHLAPPRPNADPSGPTDDEPQFFTAIQEQLGLSWCRRRRRSRCSSSITSSSRRQIRKTLCDRVARSCYAAPVCCHAPRR